MSRWPAGVTLDAWRTTPLLSKITVAADGIIIDGPALTLRSTTPIAMA